MELREYWRVITKRWWLVLLIPIVAAVVSGYYSYKEIAPTYQATAAVLLNVGNSAQPPDPSTIGGVISSQVFDNAVIQEHPNLQVSSSELGQLLTTDQSGDLLYISADGPNQPFAAAVANDVAQTFINDAQNLMGMPSSRWVNHADGTSGTAPISPHKEKNVMMAFALGLLVALGLAFMLEYLDMRVKTEADMIRFLQIPVLGTVQDYHSKIKKIAK